MGTLACPLRLRCGTLHDFLVVVVVCGLQAGGQGLETDLGYLLPCRRSREEPAAILINVNLEWHICFKLNYMELQFC